MDIRHALSKDDLFLVLEFLQRHLFCHTKEELKELLLQLKEIVPHDFLVSAKFSIKGNQITEHEISNLTYSKEWLELYIQNNFYTIDPIVKVHLATFSVQNWKDTYKIYDCPERFKCLAHDFNLLEGYTFGGVNKKGSGASLFSIAGNVENDSRSLVILDYLAPFLHQKLITVSSKNTLDPKQQLSEREFEVLKWLQKGKSTWDISVILTISERTVKFHVSNIMKKLDAVSRTHAVAIAVSQGLLGID